MAQLLPLCWDRLRHASPGNQVASTSPFGTATDVCVAAHETLKPSTRPGLSETRTIFFAGWEQKSNSLHPRYALGAQMRYQFGVLRFVHGLDDLRVFPGCSHRRTAVRVQQTRDRDAVPYLRIKKADAGFRILANCTMRSGSPRRTEAWVAFAVPHGVQRVGVVHIAMRNDGNLLLIVD